MTSRLTPNLVLLLALAAAMPWSTQAQVNPIKRDIALSEEELAAMGAAAAALYTDPAIAPETVERWQASSGTAGTVRLVGRYQFEGMRCARLVHEIKRASASDAQTLTIDRCRTPEGEWKIR